MSMNFKRAEIVASEADIIVRSAMYLIPEPNQKFRIVVVDDAGNKRYLSGSGLDGKSAYEVAVQNGYTGTVTEWLNSLEGQTGPAGASAYQVAVNNGFTGTESQWLQFLEGNTGPKGDTGDAATIQIGAVTSLPPNQQPTISNTGTTTSAILNFGIPKGDTGPTGASGSNAQSFNYKGNVTDYSGLPATAIQNDAYYNQSDQKWYIYNGNSFPLNGEGIDLGTDLNIPLVLKSFLASPGDTLKREYKWSDSNQVIYGVSPQSGLLTKNNNFFAYSEPDSEFRTWMNVPVTDFDFINLDFVRLGGSPTGPYVSLLGKKSDNTIDILIAPDHEPPTKLLENAQFLISDYQSLSFTLANFTSNNAGLNTDFKFIKKGVGGLLEEDAVKKYIDINIAGLYFGLIDVKTEGAKGDGVTNDTNAIQSCVNKCIQQGGGTLLFHQGTYLVSQINIPNVTNWLSIGFEGVFNPAQRFGTIALPGVYDPDVLVPNGTVIKGIDNTVSAIIYGQSGTSYGNFNTAFLRLKNLTIFAPNENPNIDGVNASNLFQLQCENIVIGTQVYNVHSIEPTNVKSGLVTPHNSNCAMTKLDNICIWGFYNGILVGEHTNGDSIQIQSCKNALTFDYADHASYFKRVCLQRNTNQINVAGQHVFEISQLNMEYAGSGQTTPENAWQSTQLEIKDPSNAGIANITYANVKGNVGKVSTCRIQGGNGIIIKKVGSDTKLTAPGIPD